MEGVDEILVGTSVGVGVYVTLLIGVSGGMGVVWHQELPLASLHILFLTSILEVDSVVTPLMWKLSPNPLG